MIKGDMAHHLCPLDSQQGIVSAWQHGSGWYLCSMRWCIAGEGICYHHILTMVVLDGAIIVLQTEQHLAHLPGSSPGSTQGACGHS